MFICCPSEINCCYFRLTKQYISWSEWSCETYNLLQRTMFLLCIFFNQNSANKLKMNNAFPIKGHLVRTIKGLFFYYVTVDYTSNYTMPTATLKLGKITFMFRWHFFIQPFHDLGIKYNRCNLGTLRRNRAQGLYFHKSPMYLLKEMENHRKIIVCSCSAQLRQTAVQYHYLVSDWMVQCNSKGNLTVCTVTFISVQGHCGGVSCLYP